MKHMGIKAIMASALLALAVSAAPAISAESQLTTETTKVSMKKADSQPININTATEEELTALPGIGESKAKQIIAYRNQHGKFSSAKDLMKVKGIGEKTFNALKGRVLIK